MLASYNGNIRATKILIEKGADTELLNDRGQSCLAGATFKGYTEVVKALLEGGADPEGGKPNAIEMAGHFSFGGCLIDDYR